MAVLSVRRYGDPILRQKADPVAEVTPEVQRIIADVVETMYHQVRIGLAAPQVGVSIRLILVDDGSRGPRALFNPTIVERGGSIRGEEGCLPIPGIFGEAPDLFRRVPGGLCGHLARMVGHTVSVLNESALTCLLLHINR